MKKKNIILLTIISIILLVELKSGLATEDGIIAADQQVNEKWAQVESQYQRIADLIPNLIETVKGYAPQEKIVIEDVINTRSRWASASTIDEKIDATIEMDSALSRLMVVVENYPQLKASENFVALQAQLEGIENRVVAARMDYNTAVREYNQKIVGVNEYQPRRFFNIESTEVTTIMTPESKTISTDIKTLQLEVRIEGPGKVNVARNGGFEGQLSNTESSKVFSFYSGDTFELHAFPYPEENNVFEKWCGPQGCTSPNNGIISETITYDQIGSNALTAYFVPSRIVKYKCPEGYVLTADNRCIQPKESPGFNILAVMIVFLVIIKQTNRGKI